MALAAATLDMMMRTSTLMLIAVNGAATAPHHHLWLYTSRTRTETALEELFAERKPSPILMGNCGYECVEKRRGPELGS